MRFVVTGIILLAALPGLAEIKQEKLSRDLQNSPAEASVEVIVQYRHVPTGSNHHKVRDLGGVLRSDLSVIRGASYRIQAAALAELARDPEVLYISPNRPLAGMAAAISRGYDYMPETISNITKLPSSLLQLGTGVGVAVIDSGVTPNADLATASGVSRVVYQQSFVPGTTDALDYYGHGTHVAGSIAGNGANSTGEQFYEQITGVAPSAQIINLRVLDQNGSGTDAQVINGIQRAIALKGTYNIRVINLSVGRPVFESYTVDPLCQAVEAAWKAGIVVVVAAGNSGRDNSMGTSGYGTITAPGNDPYVITVGAMKTAESSNRGDDTIASYSSKGPTLLDHVAKPDLVAPGNHIYSILDISGSLNQTFPANALAYSAYAKPPYGNTPSNYFMLSGTSMATAVVSGAAASLMGVYPTLTPDTVKARLMKTASKSFPASSQVTVTDSDTGLDVTYVSQYDLFTVGAGYLDLAAAFASMDVATLSAASPVVNIDSSGKVYATNGLIAIWGNNAVWGTGAVWGTSVFIGGTNAVWGSGAVWGTGTVASSNAVWGSGAIWGNNALWGSSTATGSESVNVSVNGEN